MKENIGCSGYFYREWKGKFYPPTLSGSKWLEFYATHFNTIEINASFYKFPEAKSLRKWYNKTPNEFKFSIKAPQIITHYKKFIQAKDVINSFYTIAEKGLKEKLECILFQLPPDLAYSPQVLTNLVKSLDNNFKNVIEFRNSSWWNKEVYDALKEKNIIFCSISFPDLPDVFVETSDTAYIRFHGKEELYKSSYSSKEMKSWIEKINLSKLQNLYVYFNNTWNMASIENAFALKREISKLSTSFEVVK